MSFGTPYRIGSASGSGTISVSTPNNAGDAIFVGITSSSAITGVTDSAGNIYALISDRTAGPDEYLYAAYGTAALGGGGTITLAGAGSGTLAIAAGCSGAGALDKAPAWNAGTSTGPASNASGTLSQASELVIAVVSANSNTSVTWGGSFTAISTLGSFTIGVISVGYLTVASTSPVTATATLGGSASWAAGLATFIPGVTASPPDMPQIRPGPVWQALLKPWIPRRPLAPPQEPPPPPPPPPTPQDLAQARPGPAWLALFKPWIPKRPMAPPGGPSDTQPAACGSTIASPGQLPGNLLSPADSDFETWTGDWAAGGNTIAGQSAAKAFCGCDSLVMIAAAAGQVSASSPLLPTGYSDPYLDSYTAGYPGSSGSAGFIASGYLFSGSGGTGYVTVNFWNSALTLISSSSGAPVTLAAGSWTPVTAAQGAPAGTAWISVTFTITGLAAGQTAFLDLAYAACSPAQVLIAWPTLPTSSAPLFCDVTPWVRADKGIKISRGRTDEVSEAQASKLTMTLDDTTGWFTVGNPGSPWYPGVMIGRRAQVNEADQNGTWHTRFDGALTDLPVTWTGGNAAEALTPAAASGVLAKLGRAAALRTMLEQEILLDNPGVFYTLADASGSATASDSSGNSAPPLTVKTYGTGGKLQFASGSAIVEAVNLTGSSPLTSVLCTPVVASPGGPANQQDQQLEGYLPAPVSAAAGFTFEIWTTGITYAFNTDTATWYAIALGNPQTGEMLGVALTGGSAGVQPALTLIHTSSIYSTSPVYTEAALTNAFNGFPFDQPGMYAVTVQGTTASLWYNSVPGSAAVQLVASITIPATLRATYLTVGGPLGGNLGWQGSLNCAAVFPSVLPPTRLQVHYQAGWSAFATPPPAAPYYIYQLIGNVTRYAGLPSWQLALPSAGVSAAGIYSLSGQNALSALQTYEQVDGGVLYENAAGQLAYQDRAARYAAQATAAPALVLAADQYGPDLLPSITDQFLVNDATCGTTVVSANGSGTTTSVTAWVRAVSPASIADYGQYPDGTPQSPQSGPYWTGTVFVNTGVPTGTLSLDVVGDAANWITGTRSQPGPRSPVVTVDLLTQPQLRAAVLGAEIGTMLQLQGLPAQYPGGIRPSDMLIEGVTDTLKWDGHGAQWTVVFNTSPSMQSGAWLAGDTGMGILDLTAVVGRGTDGNSSGQVGPPYAVPVFSGTMNNSGSVGANDMRGIASNLQQALTPPAASASQQSLAQVITGGGLGSFTAITWDTIAYDTALGFQLGSLGSGGSYYYTIPVAGTWELMATVTWASPGTAQLIAAIISGLPVIGDGIAFLAQDVITGVSGVPAGQQLSVKAPLAAGAQVAVYCGTSGSNLQLGNATGGCMFSVLFLGET